MSEKATAFDNAFPGADGLGATYNREHDRWDIYTTPTCKPTGISVVGFNRARIDWVMEALRAAYRDEDTPVANERCRDCDGYNCDDGCAYPDASEPEGANHG